MKKVCVSTCCSWSSYGSVLQAIGLKQALSKLGYDSFVVRDNPAPLAEKAFPLSLSINPKKLCKNILKYREGKKKSLLYSRAVRFINNHLDVCYYNNYEALCKNPPQADYYMTGSDQVWHPALCKPAFFLDFLPESVKRLSYAASMGVTNIAEDKLETFTKLVSKIDTVSVREKQVAEVLKGITDKPVNVHVDPTFLVDAEHWHNLQCPYDIEKPYILVYAIYWDRKLNAELKKLRKQTGCEIVVLCPGGVSVVKADRYIYDAGPGEFLYLVNYAQAVVSSSFHGAAMALHFEKKLAAVINPKSPSRLRTLLDTFAVPECEIKDVMDFDLGAYDHIKKNIAAERARSMNYLKEILET